MQDVMIDLETLGQVPGSAILSIGAYNMTTGEEFYRVIDLASNFQARMSVDAATIEWWFSQGEEAKAIFKSKDKVTLQKALEDFCKWLPNKKDLGVWGNGSVFDIVLLEVAMRRCNIEIPWFYSKIYDLRTVARLFPDVKKPRNNLAHNALEDAKCQASWLQKMIGN